MKRHEEWRNDYRLRPYMRHLTDEEAKQRARDIFNNLLVISQEGKIGMPPIDLSSMRFMALWTHVLEEFEHRFGPHPEGFRDGFIKQTPVPRPASDRAKSAGRAAANRNLTQGTYLIKYGQSEFMRAAFEVGAIRLSPASAYADPSLAPGIQDEELQIDILPPPNEFRILDPRNPADKGTVPLSMSFREESRTNYYVYCLSGLLSPRLFQDFGDADACLIVTDPKAFLSRLRRAAEVELKGYFSASGTVDYIDPLNTSWAALNVYRCKHFRYAYQKEYRLVWVPRRVAQDLPALDLRLGSLSDCCELVQL